MAEDADLQAKIAELSGRINRHKNSEHQSYHQQTPSYPSHGSHQWTPQRGTPYGVPRGRGRGARPNMNRNRTLVLNNSGQVQGGGPLPSPDASSPSNNISDPFGQGWVSKRDRHMVLINNSVYEQKTQERTKAMEQTRKQKQQAREEREKAKIQRHVQFLHNNSRPTAFPATAPQELVVHDVRFAITDGGSKLIKISGLCLKVRSLF